ncbi:MAG: TetR/AcrR family transcriptional regulator C-terminal domain-containing protein [Desulfitobacteriaceae bacterium]
MLNRYICSKIQIPDQSLPWDEQILIALKEYRAVMLTVCDSAEVLADTTPLTSKRLQIIDAIFRILLDAGLPPEDVMLTSTVLNNYVLSFVMDEMRISNFAKEQKKSVKEIASFTSDLFRILPEEQYPNIVRLADFAAIVDRDKQLVLILSS